MAVGVNHAADTLAGLSDRDCRQSCRHWHRPEPGGVCLHPARHRRGHHGSATAVQETAGPVARDLHATPSSIGAAASPGQHRRNPASPFRQAARWLPRILSALIRNRTASPKAQHTSIEILQCRAAAFMRAYAVEWLSGPGRPGHDHDNRLDPGFRDNAVPCIPGSPGAPSPHSSTLREPESFAYLQG